LADFDVVTAETQSHKFKPESPPTSIIVFSKNVLLKVKTNMTTENTPKKGNTGWYIAAAIIVIVIVVVGVLAYQYTMPSTSPSPSPSTSQTPAPSSSATTMTIYAGEPSGTAYGFGLNSSSITSNPGPTMTFTQGQTYTITLMNVGQAPHGWEIVSTKAVGTAMFGAGIGVTSFISAGASASVTFTPTQSGDFFYLCTVPGHVALGMWGNVVVNP
jgi:uncharacterized cupredoxin-like copper-binding protein